MSGIDSIISFIFLFGAFVAGGVMAYALTKANRIEEPPDGIFTWLGLVALIFALIGMGVLLWWLVKFVAVWGAQ